MKRIWAFFVDHGRVKPIESYPERDCYFYPNESVDEGHIHCPEGYYTVFFPSDIHRPLLAVDDKPIKNSQGCCKGACVSIR